MQTYTLTQYKLGAKADEQISTYPRCVSHSTQVIHDYARGQRQQYDVSEDQRCVGVREISAVLVLEGSDE